MSNNKEFKVNHDAQEIEDVTKYGEFVSSYFAWVSLDKQKQRAKQMENMTNKNN